MLVLFATHLEITSSTPQLSLTRQTDPLMYTFLPLSHRIICKFQPGIFDYFLSEFSDTLFLPQLQAQKCNQKAVVHYEKFLFCFVVCKHWKSQVACVVTKLHPEASSLSLMHYSTVQTHLFCLCFQSKAICTSTNTVIFRLADTLKLGCHVTKHTTYKKLTH